MEEKFHFDSLNLTQNCHWFKKLATVFDFDCFVALVEPQKPAGGYLWRFSSGVIGTTSGAVTGAVGLGFGGIKWVATKGYNAGSAVVGTTKTVASKVPIPAWKKKDKKE